MIPRYFSIADYFFYMRPTRPHALWGDMDETDDEWFYGIDTYFYRHAVKMGSCKYLSRKLLPIEGIYPPIAPIVTRKYKKKKKVAVKKVSESIEIPSSPSTTSQLMSCSPIKRGDIREGKKSPFSNVSPKFFAPVWRKKRKSRESLSQ